MLAQSVRIWLDDYNWDAKKYVDKNYYMVKRLTTWECGKVADRVVDLLKEVLDYHNYPMTYCCRWPDGFPHYYEALLYSVVVEDEADFLLDLISNTLRAVGHRISESWYEGDTLYYNVCLDLPQYMGGHLPQPVPSRITKKIMADYIYYGRWWRWEEVLYKAGDRVGEGINKDVS